MQSVCKRVSDARTIPVNIKKDLCHWTPVNLLGVIQVGGRLQSLAQVIQAGEVHVEE